MQLSPKKHGLLGSRRRPQTYNFCVLELYSYTTPSFHDAGDLIQNCTTQASILPDQLLPQPRKMFLHFFFKFFKNIFILTVWQEECAHIVCVLKYGLHGLFVCGGQRTTPFHSGITRDQTQVGQACLCSKHLYPLNHLMDPQLLIPETDFSFMVCFLALAFVIN